MPVKRIVLTIITALVFTAAAQTLEYGTLLFSLADNATPRNVVWETQHVSVGALTLGRLAGDLFPERDPGSVGLAAFLSFLAAEGWTLRSHVVDRGFHIVVLERSGQ